MSFFKKIGKGIKNIGKGLGKVFKGVGRFAKKLWNMPLVRTALVAAAAFYTGGAAAGLLGGAGGAAGGAAAGAAGGALGGAAVGAVGDAATGRDVSWKTAGQDALTGALSGGVSGYGAGQSAAAAQQPAGQATDFNALMEANPPGAGSAVPAKAGGFETAGAGQNPMAGLPEPTRFNTQLAEASTGYQAPASLSGYEPSTNLMGSVPDPTANAGSVSVTGSPGSSQITGATLPSTAADPTLWGQSKAFLKSLVPETSLGAAALTAGGTVASGYAQGVSAERQQEDAIAEAKRQRISQLLTSGLPIYQAQIMADMEFNRAQRQTSGVRGLSFGGL